MALININIHNHQGIKSDEQMWRQKSRVKWLKEGDKNTKFFHCMANSRRRSNFIGDIMFEGVRVSEPSQVKCGIFNFFKSYFKNVPWQRPKATGLSLKRLLEEERDFLERPFDVEEVKEAVSSCDGNKAPGPDGMNLNFIRANWEVVQEDFLRFIHEFYKEGSIVEELNNTFITLIPKCGRLETMSDFRPISLVGSMYKVLAKILANRLKSVMDVVIGETQMAFVKKRQIMDSFVIAEEIIHSWRKDNVGGLLLKLDFEKAYYSVDHNFLDSMMKDMGFGERWRMWIRWCISTPKMSVLVNGSPTAQFILERGLRQGDPLSPFLFNIISEGLSCLFKKAVVLGLMKGVVFGSDAIHITHLQFADVTIIFLEPRVEYLMNTRRILRCFELATGLRINFYKSCVVNVRKGGNNDSVWADCFGCNKADLPISYLGFPLGARPLAKTFWNPLMSRLEKRLASWKKKFLNKGGRMVLIKSVLSSIHTYYLSVFKLPVGVAMGIEKLQRSFFWDDGNMKRKIHAVDWVSICRSKRNGGLGIGRMEDKNKSLLAKWVWRFGKEENSLWRRVICAKYGIPCGTITWDWKSSESASFFVKTVSSLYSAGSLTEKFLKDGLKIIIGNGRRANFWNEPWGKELPLKFSFPRIFALAVDKSGVVEDFGRWQGSNWVWEVPLRRPLFDWEKNQWQAFQYVLQCNKILGSIVDDIAWLFSSNV
ncbi:hypothetical protein Dsin_021006 [Dipteronia sinensis]|uniref:Reverse transcriptase domain-containing protein n=1 Tax=Dipteronia sinensis TaxID=43782 RepID=A0AAE0AAJ8_9ROSI|nr:hypothetical protein Dsin_021006 [Dipteronia sinensis]